MHDLKAFGLAVAVVLAMGAMTASAAQAELTFTGFDGVGNHVDTLFRANQQGTMEFTSTGGFQGVSCTGGSFLTTAKTGKSKTLTASGGNKPKCKFYFLREMNRYMNSCDFSYNITKEINVDKFEGTADIQCTTKGDAIYYQVTKIPPNETETLCTIKVEEQNGIGPIVYENITPVGEFSYIAITANATNVKSITEAKSGNPADCNVAKLGTHTTGTLKEETLVDGLSSEEEVHVAVSG